MLVITLETEEIEFIAFIDGATSLTDISIHCFLFLFNDFPSGEVRP
jgi:hypothetical protein